MMFIVYFKRKLRYILPHLNHFTPILLIFPLGSLTR